MTTFFSKQFLVQICILFLFGLLSSCNKTEIQETIFKQSSYLKIDNEPINHINLYKNEQSKVPYLQTQIYSKQLISIYQKLKNNFGGDLENIEKYPKQIVFYTVGKLDNFELNDIIGLSYFLEEDGNYVHNYFNITNGKAILNDAYTARGTAFKLSDLSILAKKENPSKFVSWVLLSEYTNASSKRVSSIEKPFNPIKIIEKFNQNHFEYDIIGGCSEFQCATEQPGSCYSNENGIFCKTNDGDEIPVPNGDGCLSMSIDNGMSNSRSTSNNQLDLKKAYDFRDNFLKKSKLGKEYINYYYAISKVSQEKGILSKNFSDHLNFALETFKVAEVLQDDSNNEILISDSYEKSAKSLIALYRKEKDNNEFQKILDNIEKDMYKFKGKRKSEIIKELDK